MNTTRKKVTMGAASVLVLCAARSYADPFNNRPVPIQPPPASEQSLQQIFDGLYVSGPGISAANDQSPAAVFRKTAGSPTASFIIELTAGAASQTFGLYNYADPTKQATIFTGSSTAGDQATVIFNFATGDVVVTLTDVSAGTSTTTTYAGVFAPNTQANFGFVLDSFGPDYFTEDSLNGGTARALAYQGDNATVLNLPYIGPGTFSDDEYIFAWEDGTDFDYQDMVVLVQSIEAVAAPGAIVLGLIGLGLVGLVGRRRA